MKLSKNWLAPSAILLFLLVALPLKGNSKTSKLNTEKNIDLVRYSGKWYEIARLPNWFERNCNTDIQAEYEILGKNEIRVKNSCQKSDGKRETAIGIAVPSNDPEVTFRVTFAPKAVRILPFVWANYSVISLDENYQYVLIGEPSRKYLWILSREPQLNTTTIDNLLDIARSEGFDTAKLIVSKQITM